MAGDGGRDHGQCRSERLRDRSRERDSDRIVRTEQLLLRRLGECLHALTRREPAHARGADRRSQGRGADLTVTLPACVAPVAMTPVRTVARGVGNRNRRVPRLSRSFDDAHGSVERDRDGAAVGDLQPAAAEPGGRQCHRERLAAPSARRASPPNRAGERSPRPSLARRRECPGGRKLVAAKLNRDCLAPAVRDGDGRDVAGVAGLHDARQRDVVWLDADLRPGEERRPCSGGAEDEDDDDAQKTGRRRDRRRGLECSA